MTSRKARHNQRVRDRILAAAAAAFRAEGYAGTNLDRIMEGAGLTRGAFYAHFRSKPVLFVEVIRADQPLLTWLRGRSDAAPDALLLGMQHIFRRYLDPGNLETIARTCSLACLCRDVALAGDAARVAHEQAMQEILREMPRGQGPSPDDPNLAAALTLAVGAIGLAAACESPEMRGTILNAASEQVTALLDAARRDREDAPPARAPAFPYRDQPRIG